jgi:hypothetical protein
VFEDVKVTRQVEIKPEIKKKEVESKEVETEKKKPVATKQASISNFFKK